MDEKLLEIVTQFDCYVKNTYRGRGGIVCNTDKGLMILKEFHSSAGKLMDEYELKKQLIEQNFTFVDQHIKTKKGTFFAEDRYHTIYVMKQCYEGKECDIRSKEDIRVIGLNLANFHQTVRKVNVSERLKQQYTPLEQVLEKRTKELKRAKLHMETSMKKGVFEHLYMKSFPPFFEQAKKALDVYKNIISQEHLQIGICHGAYNQHHVIRTEFGVATINFEHFCYQNQLFDLHQILRKVMEKNEYDWEYGRELLKGYEELLPLSQEEYHCLYALLQYPDKYFKIANHYNSKRKAFISPKDVEKLEDVIDQNKKKEQFLQEYENKYLI